MAEIVGNDHILFAFSAICINNILNENAYIFRKSQGLAALYFLVQQSYMTCKCENGQNDSHGFSSVKSPKFPQQVKALLFLLKDYVSVVWLGWTGVCLSPKIFKRLDLLYPLPLDAEQWRKRSTQNSS